MLEAVLFDLGGTLLEYDSTELSYMDLHRIGLCGLHEYLARDGQDLPREDLFCDELLERTEARWRQSLTRMEGLNTADIFHDVLDDLGADVQHIDMHACIWAFYRPMAPHIRAYEDTYETLAHLRSRGLRIGLISNTAWPGALHNEDLARFDLTRFFDHLTYSSETRHCKPHSEIFLETLKVLEVEPGQAAFVGDRLYDDIGGAQAVGMKAILKIIAHREEKSDVICPDARIRALRELPAVLKQLFSS